MAGANSSKLPPPSTGKLLAVLSIDGGGIKGLIPAVVLQYLEGELKKLAKDDGVRIADYFDVIAGTSTGGLIATMLAAPNGNKTNPRPKYSADDIKDFYIKDGPQIFPPGTPNPSPITPGPKYDGVHLRTRLEEELRSTRLDQTLTNVVIPSFDIKRISPTIFSSYKVQQAPYKYLNARLSDIGIATSAAPTYLPANYFITENGNPMGEFNMIDGGAAAGNPTAVALSEIGQEKEKHPESYPMMKRLDDYTNILLVSLGCGEQAGYHGSGFTANQVNNWSLAEWLQCQGRSPLVEIVSEGASDMLDYYIYSLFKAQNAESNYLRVQTDKLTPDMGRMDNASDDNLKNLVDCAHEMLQAEVKRINPVTFELEPIGDGTTYAEALSSVAEVLHKEKKARIDMLASKN